MDKRASSKTVASDKKKRRRGYLTLSARDPRDGKLWDVLVSQARLDFVAKLGPVAIWECARIVPHVLEKPTAVFEGLRRDEDDDKYTHSQGWLCYTGVPLRSFRTDGTEAEPYPGEVYLVFLNHDRVAYNWRWEKCDPVDSRLPGGFEQRFRERLL